MTTPTTSTLDSFIKNKDAQLEIALIALREIASPVCPQRQFRAQYALVDIGKLEDAPTKTAEEAKTAEPA